MGVIKWYFAAALLASALVEGNRPEQSRKRINLDDEYHPGLDDELSAEGYEDQELLDETSTQNTDRMQCLQQDNLDMIYPSDPKYVLRMVYPRAENIETTDQDLYVVAENVRVDAIDMRFIMDRNDETGDVEFAIDGGDFGTPASISADVKGLDILGGHWKIQQLTKTLTGDTLVKITFDAVGRFKVKKRKKQPTGEYAIKVQSIKVSTFNVDLENGYLAATVKMLINRLLPLSTIEKALAQQIGGNIPKPLRNILGGLVVNQFDCNLAVSLNGRIDEDTKLFKTNVKVETFATLIPADFLGLVKNLKNDFRVEMRKQAVALFKSRRMQVEWRKVQRAVGRRERKKFIQKLKKFGVAIDDEFRAFMLKAETLQEVEDEFMKFFESGMDSSLGKLDPILKGYKEGKDVFKGLDMGIKLGVGWKKKMIDAFIAPREDSVQLKATNLKQLIQVPKSILDILNVHLAKPTDGNPSNISLGSMKFESGKAEISKLRSEGLNILLGNGSDSQVLQINASLNRLKVGLHESKRKSLAFLTSVIVPMMVQRIETSGDIGLYLGSEGITANVDSTKLPPSPPTAVPEWRQRFDESESDGLLDAKLPDGMNRPTEKGSDMNQEWVLENVPHARITLGLQEGPGKLVAGSMVGTLDEKHRTLALTLSMHADLTIDTIMRKFLGARSTSDDGYPFYINKFLVYKLHASSQEDNSWSSYAKSYFVSSAQSSQATEPNGIQKLGVKLVVVNCGYLRIFSQTDLTKKTDLSKEERLKRAHTEGHFDLSQYTRAPEPFAMLDGSDDADVGDSFEEVGDERPKCTKDSGKSCCVDLSFWNTAVAQNPHMDEARVCGETEDIQAMRKVIAEQIRRYTKDNRSSDWNYGTHPSDEQQFLLAEPVTQSKNLSVLAMEHLSKPSSSSVIEEASVSTNEACDNSDGQAVEVEQSAERQDARKGWPWSAAAPSEKRNFNELRTDEFSDDRRQCLADLDRDRSVFPPSAYPAQELPFLRMSVPGVPDRLSDLHVSVGKLAVTRISLMVHLKRKRKTTYQFFITDANDPGEPGILSLTLRDLHVLMKQKPGSLSLGELMMRKTVMGAIASYETFDSFVHNTRSHFARTKSTNEDDYQKEFGHITKGTVGLKVRMSGKISLNEDKWKLHGKSVEYNIEPLLDGGFPFEDTLKSLIKGSLVQKTIFKSVWPLLAKNLIPIDVAKSLHRLEEITPQYSHKIHIEAWCDQKDRRVEKKDRDCINDELHLDVKTSHTLDANTKGLLENYIDLQVDKVSPSDFDEEEEEDAEDDRGFLAKLVQTARTSYMYRNHIFLDTTAKANINAALSDEHDISVDASTAFHFPQRLLESYLAKDSSVLDLLRKNKQQKLDGNLHFHDGVMKIPQISLNDVYIPMVDNQTKKTEYLTLDVLIDDINVKRLQGPPDDIWAPVGPFDGLDVPKIGAYVKGSQSLGAGIPSLTANIAASRVDAEYFGEAKPKPAPSNRTADKTEADGVVPEEFQRPLPRKPGKSDLKTFVRNASVGVVTDNYGYDQKGHDTTHLGLKLHLQATVRLSNEFFRSLQDSSDLDYGYMYVAIPGMWKEVGTIDGMPIPPEQAIATLSCGSLEIWKAHDEQIIDATPFERRFAVIDLADGTQFKYDSEEEMVKNEWINRCMYYGDPQTSFCARKEDMKNLTTAIDLQQTRFANVPEGRDGTWFAAQDDPDGEDDPTRSFPIRDPLIEHDIRDPTQIWKDIIKSDAYGFDEF